MYIPHIHSNIHASIFLFIYIYIYICQNDRDVSWIHIHCIYTFVCVFLLMNEDPRFVF